ncbi:MAG: hypothetical protein ACI4M3_01475 [Acutalibacteraceae bacterium]
MNKKKKLVVLSSVLATCMLFSISAFALSSQGETETLDDNSTVISEQSEEQGLTAEQFAQLVKGESTYDDMVALFGKPHKQLTDDGQYLFYTRNANNPWNAYYTANGDRIVVYCEDMIVKRVDVIRNYESTVTKEQGVTTEQFLQFTKGVSTYDDVKAVVGGPDGYLGSGIVRDVYFTVDGYAIIISYRGEGNTITEFLIRPTIDVLRGGGVYSAHENAYYTTKGLAYKRYPNQTEGVEYKEYTRQMIPATENIL